MNATFKAYAIWANKCLYYAQTNPTIDLFLLTHLSLEASPYIFSLEASPYIFRGLTIYIKRPHHIY